MIEKPVDIQIVERLNTEEKQMVSVNLNFVTCLFGILPQQ